MRSRAYRNRLLAAGSVAGLLAAALLVGCSTPTTSRLAKAGETSRLGPNEYTGNESCKPCHPREYGEHEASRHAQTLRPVSALKGHREVPQTGAIAHTGFELQLTATGWRIGNGKDSSEVLLAFGSGKSGMTYAGGMTHDSFIEFRYSFDARNRSWYATPGQETATGDGLGKVHMGLDARRCLGCHSAERTAGSINLDPKLMGVGCESCHGPGSQHIQAAKQKGAQDLKMAKLDRLPALELNQVCARCHLASSDVQLASVDISSTNRFQAYGLESSACFIKSNGLLSCSSCHNPHTNVETRPEVYTAKCLTCHSTSSTSAVRGTSDPPKICPVNTVSNCTGCHMPKRQLVPGAHLKVEAADHLIWAVRQSRQ